jgi:hypothetical protein
MKSPNFRLPMKHIPVELFLPATVRSPASAASARTCDGHRRAAAIRRARPGGILRRDLLLGQPADREKRLR